MKGAKTGQDSDEGQSLSRTTDSHFLMGSRTYRTLCCMIMLSTDSESAVDGGGAV